MGFNHPFSYKFKTWIQDSHVFDWITWITINQIPCFDHGTYGDGSRWSRFLLYPWNVHTKLVWTYGCKRYWSINHHKSKLFENGSIPINSMFRGMNIHLPAILGFTRYQGFDPSPFERCFRISPWNVCIGIDLQKAQLWNADGMYIHCLTGATNNPFY